MIDSEDELQKLYDDCYASLFPAKKKGVLYHYTSLDGLRGIIENREIWATRINFLNDTNEYKYLFQLCQIFLADRTSPYWQNNFEVEPLDKDIEYYEDFYTSSIYVASFSEKGDSLDQWRGYCQNGGYSIGFYTRNLPIFSERFFKVIYDKKRQEELLKKILTVYKSKSSLKELVKKRILIQNLHKVSPMLKNNHFSTEIEWRFLKMFPSSSELKFRNRNNCLIPYHTISLASEDKPLKLKEIIISPTTLEPNLVRQSLYQYLQQKKAEGLVEYDEVLISSIPYITR